MKFTRRTLAQAALAVPAAAQTRSGAPTLTSVQPYIWRLRLGTPERYTPCSAPFARTPPGPVVAVTGRKPKFPLDPKTIQAQPGARGFTVTLPLEANELIYGLGLQLKGFIHRGFKRTLRVNADPVTDAGDSHAPVPFYLSTRGYGVLIDTARYAVLYCGKVPAGASGESVNPATAASQSIATALPNAYTRRRIGDQAEMLIEIPSAAGVDLYFFEGPTMLEAVKRYVLFSGGGPVPPRWGLGVWYRAYGQFGQDEVTGIARGLRDRKMPCDVIGLEPGWQSHAYSCSFVWSDKFREPKRLFAEMKEMNLQVNAWEHAFTHPTSPIHQSLQPHSGNWQVWGGLVPDFNQEPARRIFAGYHEREHVALGLSGYKLDECDNSDYTGGWSFPEASRFPSGIDGEQYHSTFGARYAQTIEEIYKRRGQRTYGLVRSAGALCAALPFVLYSDLYEHRDFLRGMVNAGFSGLLWTPEVRDARDAEDLLRRLQTVVMSPLAMINAWYIRNPPWKQVDRERNNQGQFTEDWEKLEAQCRQWLEFRMRWIPYLHAAFVRYHEEGTPPFRALVLDYPDQAAVLTLDDAWMMGDRLLVAPVIRGQSKRKVYLPHGTWHDFWTGQAHPGGQTMEVEVPLDRIPLFVKGGSVLPLARVTQHTADAESLALEVRVYGDGSLAATLYEEDGKQAALAPGRMNRVTLGWDAGSRQGSMAREGSAPAPQYRVEGWTAVG